MKEYRNIFGKVIVATAKEYNYFIKKTVNLTENFRETYPDMLYDVEKGENPLLVKGGYVVMVYPRFMMHSQDGFIAGVYYEEKDAKNGTDAIRKVKEKILCDIAGNVPVDTYIVKLFEKIKIRVGLFF
jgi:hypothetical protein